MSLRKYKTLPFLYSIFCCEFSCDVQKFAHAAHDRRNVTSAWSFTYYPEFSISFYSRAQDEINVDANHAKRAANKLDNNACLKTAIFPAKDIYIYILYKSV